MCCTKNISGLLDKDRPPAGKKNVPLERVIQRTDHNLRHYMGLNLTDRSLFKCQLFISLI